MMHIAGGERQLLGQPTLKRSTLRGDATRVLRAQIIAGALDLDRMYSIGELAEELGTSPTPVREALLQLESDGLVEMSRNRGFRVRRVTEQDLDEIMECRLLLEPPMVAKLAGKLASPAIEELRALANATIAAVMEGDTEAFLSVDRDFHLGMLELSGNHRLVAIVAGLRDQARLHGIQKLAGTEALIKSANEHVELLEAVASGAGAAAQQLLAKHIRHSRGLWAGKENES